MIKFIVGVSILLLSYSVCALPTAKYTLAVVDEEKKPIKGADASISFMRSKTSGWGGKTNFIEGKTDEHGMYTGEGTTQKYGVYGARYNGYYSTSFKYEGFTGVSGIFGFRKWQPWNPTLEVVLRKIKNPIPMYAYNTEWIDIPKNNEFIGYDLIKHDWVTPYGKGITADLLFLLDKDMRAKDDYDAYLTLKFSDPLDGIQSVLVDKEQGSEYRLAYHAPNLGYENKLEKHKYRRKNKTYVTSYKDEQNYYFRVRSNGDEENSLYGKIHGNIEFSRFGDSNGAIRFTYYLNPTKGDTNIEFAPQKNLFDDFTYKVINP